MLTLPKSFNIAITLASHCKLPLLAERISTLHSEKLQEIAEKQQPQHSSMRTSQSSVDEEATQESSQDDPEATMEEGRDSEGENIVVRASSKNTSVVGGKSSQKISARAASLPQPAAARNLSPLLQTLKRKAAANGDNNKSKTGAPKPKLSKLY